MRNGLGKLLLLGLLLMAMAFVPSRKKVLRVFVLQARQKGRLGNVHGQYPQAVKDVARELDVPLIDLNQLSMDAFSARGQDYVGRHYFMNFEAGLYPAYPQGQKDNTHFQPEGARAVARLVFEAMKKLPGKK